MAMLRIAWLLWIQMLPVGLVLLDRVANRPDSNPRGFPGNVLKIKDVSFPGQGRRRGAPHSAGETPQIAMRPLRMPLLTASVRLETASFPRMELM